MLTAISRYGARALPITEDVVAGCHARGEFIQGPQIAEFEAAFAGRHGLGPAHARDQIERAARVVQSVLERA